MAYTYHFLTAGDRMYAGCANSLRLAILTRAAMAGRTITGLPYTNLPAVSATSRIKINNWITNARLCIEDILSANKYRRLVRDTMTPPYPMIFTPWNKTELITQVQTWVSNSYSQSGDWMAIPPSDYLQKPHVGYFNELICACEVLEFMVITPTEAAVTAESKTVYSTEMTVQVDAATAYGVARGLLDAKPWQNPGAMGTGYSSSGNMDCYHRVSPDPDGWQSRIFATRGDDFTVTFPNYTVTVDASPIAVPIYNYFMAQRATCKPFGSIGDPDAGFHVYGNAHFVIPSGNVLGKIGWIDSVGGFYDFYGWVAFGASLGWNNETRHFSTQWTNLDPYLYPHPASFAYPADETEIYGIGYQSFARFTFAQHIGGMYEPVAGWINYTP